jgi:hypothetical protein
MSASRTSAFYWVYTILMDLVNILCEVLLPLGYTSSRPGRIQLPALHGRSSEHQGDESHYAHVLRVQREFSHSNEAM